MGSSNTKDTVKDPEVEELPEGQVPISPTDIPSSIPQEERTIATTSVSNIETKIDLSGSGAVDPSSVASRTDRKENSEVVDPSSVASEIKTKKDDDEKEEDEKEEEEKKEEEN